MASKQNRVRDETANRCTLMARITKDQSGSDSTAKQGVTTINEDSAAYTVSTSSLTMAVEAVTHALRWIASRGDSHITHATILTDSMSLLQLEMLNGKPRLESVNGRHPPSKNPAFVLSWTCRIERNGPNR